LPEGIDTIIHLAGKAHALAEVAQDEAEYFRVNTDGTRRLLEAARRAGVRSFVLFSTVKAAGDKPSAEGRMQSEEVPPRAANDGLRDSRNDHKFDSSNTTSGVDLAALDESCLSLPDTPYGQSKRAAERLVLEGGYVPHPVVIRPCLVYGPTPKGNLEKMITAVRRGRFPPLPEVGNRRSMVHVDDVIAAALLAADHPAASGQIYIASDNRPFSTRELFEWICIAAGRRVPRWTIPLWLLRLLGRVGDGIGRVRGRRFVFNSDALEKLTGNAWYSSAKLQRELGWKPEHTLMESMPEVLRSAKHEPAAPQRR
jgi:nucleoside-diphosphate-sugar epimerase